MKNPAPRPVSTSERLDFVDVLRGFAVFGIFVVNMLAFAGQEHGVGGYPAGSLDRAIILVGEFFIRAKFYTLFSFLFGWGMALQLTRAQDRGVRFVPVYLRRLTVLLLFGLIHAIFIWWGDILTGYALMGFLLILFRNRSDKFVLGSSFVLMLFGMGLFLPHPAIENFRSWYFETVMGRGFQGASPDVIYAGSYFEIVQFQFKYTVNGILGMLFFAPVILPMFLWGMFVGRRRIFRRIADEWFKKDEVDTDLADFANEELSTQRSSVQSMSSKVRKVLLISLVVGVLFNGLFVMTSLWSANNSWPAFIPADYQRFVRTAARNIGAPAFMLMYVSGIILLMRRETWNERLSPLGNVGRMALSNYIFQSLVAIAIFHDYGLGWYGELRPTMLLILTIAIYLLQIRLSKYWLERHQFGPLEWAWRTLTYGRFQPWYLHQSTDRTGMSVGRKLTAVFIIIALLLGAGYWFSRTELGEETLDAGLAEIVSGEATAIPLPTSTPPQIAPTPTPIATPAVEAVAFSNSTDDFNAIARAFDGAAAMTHIETAHDPVVIADQFADYGLQPAGDDGTFFQSFPFTQSAFDGTPALSIDGQVYQPYTDFVPLVGQYMGDGVVEGDTVWVSNCAHADFDVVNVVNKIVICRDREGREFTASRQALEHGAAGLLLIGNETSPSPDSGSHAGERWLADAHDLPTFRVSPALAADLLAGSDKTPADLSLSFASYPLNSRVAMDVALSGCGDCVGRNVLAVLPGRDPEYADEVVIIAANHDTFGDRWAGANDNGSGTAVLLSIAKLFQEQGFVPRRTLLFAAWDGKEAGMLGSTHYVNQPRYPLENTTAVLTLEMLGAGDEILYIDGNQLAGQVEPIAASHAISATLSSEGGRDHAPFMDARIPAARVGWAWDGDSYPAYHLPGDTIDKIESQKLQTAGELAVLMALTLTDGDGVIDELLLERETAVLENDLNAFLATSSIAQDAPNAHWFNEITAYAPYSMTLNATDVQIIGDTVVADVSATAFYDDDGTERSFSARQPVRFVYEAGAWRWNGADLAPVFSNELFTINASAGLDGDMTAFAPIAAAHYSTTATLLDLPVTPAMLAIYAGSESLRADTALTLRPDAESWVAADTIRLAYAPHLTDTDRLPTAMTQLLLANAGVTEADAGWLWRGLPLAIVTNADLQTLVVTLNSEKSTRNASTDWAVVSYLQQQLGWNGLGEFIVDAGENGVEAALESALQLSSSEFEQAWRGDWVARLDGVETAVSDLLSTRAAAVQANDLDAFMATIATDVPTLAAEQTAWFAVAQTVEGDFMPVDGQLVHLHDDGSVLVQIGDLEVRLQPQNGELLWAGAPVEVVEGAQFDIYYPSDMEEAAAEGLLAAAEARYDEIGATLALPALDSSTPISDSQKLIIKVYENQAALRQSVQPAGAMMLASGWTDADQAIKIAVSTEEEMTAALTMQLARHQLRMAGIEEEWLLLGVPMAQSVRYGDTATIALVGDQLRKLLLNAGKGALYPLAELPSADELEEDERLTAVVQAWDAARYVDWKWGTAIPDDLQTEWETSFKRGHVSDEWIDIAMQFDAEHTAAQVAELSTEAMGGRPSGSPEAHAAAELIADKFAAYGLQPVGRDGFYQPFPITYTTLLATPRLEFTLEDGESDPFVFREDFVTLESIFKEDSLDGFSVFSYKTIITITANALAGGGVADGELVWLADGNVEGLDLTGKIVLRKDIESLEEEVAALIEHGAAGLIFVGERDTRKERVAKAPLPANIDPDFNFPIAELSLPGYRRLLESVGHTSASIIDTPPALPLGIQAHMEVAYSEPETAVGQNVLAMLPGSDPQLRDQPILLGAHYDHVGNDPDGLFCDGVSVAVTEFDENSTACERVPGLRYSGANDDASGVAVLLELARLWQETGYVPQRPIVFAAWDAQEMGQVGSSFYVEQMADDLPAVMLQLDGVGGGAGYYLTLEATWAEAGMVMYGMDTGEGLVDGRLKMTVPAGVSDHLPFQEAGVSTAFFTWTGASEDNWPDDLADEVELSPLEKTGRMVALMVMGLGSDE